MGNKAEGEAEVPPEKETDFKTEILNFFDSSRKKDEAHDEPIEPGPSTVPPLDDRERKELERMVTDLQQCVEQAQKDLTDKLKSCEDLGVSALVAPLLEKIHEVGTEVNQELVDLLNVENRPLRAILVGPSNYGKSALLSSMIGKTDMTTTQTETAGWYQISTSLEILDIYGMKPNQTYPQEKAEELLNAIQKKPPDIALIVLDLSASRNWEWYSDSINFIIGLLSPQVELFWVASKLDQAGELDLGVWKKDDDETWTIWSKRMTDNYSTILDSAAQKFSAFTSFKKSQLAVTSVLRSGDVGVTNQGGLLDTINAKAPIYAQIVREGVSRYKAMRKAMAVKIITSFVVINTLVGALPVIDLVLAPLVDYSMLNILQHLRTRRTRTAEKYRNKYLLKLAAGMALRGALLVAGLVAEMTLVFAVIGATSGAMITGGTTLGLGYHAYEYFTAEEAHSDDEEEDIFEDEDHLKPDFHDPQGEHDDCLTDVSDSSSDLSSTEVMPVNLDAFQERKDS